MTTPGSDRLRDPNEGDPISAEQARIQNELLRRLVKLPDSITDSSGTRMVTRRSSSVDELYWCILTESHPGRGKCFNIIVGTWCPSEHKFRFDCDATEYEVGIDWHYGVPYPTEAGARGWFKRMTSNWTDSGYIYVCVSLDCESPGACDGDYDTDGDSIPCLTLDGDPCEEGS